MENFEVNITSPFNHIAMSLSGGGIRAVGYHLGTLDYLDRIGLLKEVHTLSSVSGGSLVAIGYALSLKKGESFQEFYDNLCEFLPEVNTFEELLKILENPAPTVASGSNTLITALANVYREKYFEKYYGDPTFGVFLDQEPEIHLKELVFNATEFKTGVGFRFQTGLHGNLIGNSKVSISEKLARDIRMSDIMAASSCIPGGMEPLMFPQDFHWPGDPTGASLGLKAGSRPRCEEVEAELERKYNVNNIPLMDGGIYDNQGITSIILAQARIHKKRKKLQSENPVDDSIHDETDLEPQRPRHWARWILNSMEGASDVEHQKDMGEVDLFIVSDTPIHSDPMYSIPSREKKKGTKERIRELKLGTVNVLGWVATIALVLSVLVSASFIGTAPDLVAVIAQNLGLDPSTALWERVLVYVYYAVLVIQISVVGFAVFLMFRFRRITSQSVNKMVSILPRMSQPVWSYAKNLTLGTLIDMVSLRASSMTALTGKIFMHRVRQMGYSLLYSHDHFGKKVLDNNINDTLHAEHNSNIPDFAKDPSDAAEQVTHLAATMETKLWVNEPEDENERDDLEILIAAGHISTCFNIIEYLWEYHRNEEGELAEEMLPLFNQAKSDWLHLNEDPYWLLDIRENEGKPRGELFWRKFPERKAKKA